MVDLTPLSARRYQLAARVCHGDQNRRFKTPRQSENARKSRRNSLIPGCPLFRAMESAGRSGRNQLAACVSHGDQHRLHQTPCHSENAPARRRNFLKTGCPVLLLLTLTGGVRTCPVLLGCNYMVTRTAD